MGGKQQERNEADKGRREKETHKETTRLRGKKKRQKKSDRGVKIWQTFSAPLNFQAELHTEM